MITNNSFFFYGAFSMDAAVATMQVLTLPMACITLYMTATKAKFMLVLGSRLVKTM